ncbi:AMP-binding protein [Leptodesmis sp.]|uniref:AMP-binding protein n=1 Tax=Leptodesmis sp. TaxID=3100501 RepID=UPI0040535B47
MTYYYKLGTIPHKQHTQFRQPDGSLYHEELMGIHGFSGIQPLLYHLHPPTQIQKILTSKPVELTFAEPGALQPHHLRTANVPEGGDAIAARIPLLANSDVCVSVVRPTEAMNYWYRYASGDEVIFIHEDGLVTAGFQPGDAIAVILPMTVEAVAIYLGIIAAGCVVISIADSFSANEIAIRLKITKTKAIFTQDLIQRVGQQFSLYTKVMNAQAPTAIVLPLTDSLSVNLRQGDLSWTKFLSSREEFDALPCDPGTPTNILFSSGTTGEPKAILWTHTTPIKCAVDAYLHHDIHSSDILTWPTSLGWMMGPWLIYTSLINQAAIGLYYGAPTRRDFGQFIQNAKVTMLGLVPSLVSTWKTTACMEGLD